MSPLPLVPELPRLPGPDRTRDRRAVVTGAGAGIGRAFAEELARRGGAVVCADIDEIAARRTVERLQASGARALAVTCDVADAGAVHELAETAAGWLAGPVDLVVNNAGVGAGGRLIGQTPLADWHRTLGVNLWGVVHGCHEFAPRLRAAAAHGDLGPGGGGIINVASAAGFAAAPRMGAYNVSKAAVLALSETLAAELAGTGIAVTAVCPTFVRTDILRGELVDADAPGVRNLAHQLMRLTGITPDRIVTAALDAHAAGRLYAIPQLDARLVWQLKRLLPAPYTRVTGLLARAVQER